MDTYDNQEKAKWRLGKVKFYDTNKEFGFARDLTISNYTEEEDDVYIGASVSVPHELTDDAYIVFRKVPSSRRPGTFKAEDVRPLLSHSDDIEPLVEEVGSTSEREELRRYLQSERANWQIGKVKFFDSNKGFGFIEPLKHLDLLDGDDAYVNERNVDAESLSDGAHVAFRIAPSRNPGEYQASGVQTLKTFGRASVSFTEDLAFWMLGGADLSPKISTMAQLIPRSEVTEVLELIEMVARGDEERPDRKRGTALRLLGDVLEKAESEALLRSEWVERVWEKYSQEVYRLADRNMIPRSVAPMLWMEGFLPTLEPETIDALVDRIWQDDSSDEVIDLSYQSDWRSKTLRNTEIPYVIQRFSQTDIANWVDRHTEAINEAVRIDTADTVSLLEKHLDVLKGIRQEGGNDASQNIDRYTDAIVRLAQHCYKRNELTHDEAFSLWEDGFLGEVAYSDFIKGYSDCWGREQRVDLLKRLDPEQRRQFAVQRTKELLKAREESTEVSNESLSRWLEDVETYEETVENDNEGEATCSTEVQCKTVLREKGQEKTQVALYGEGFLSSVPEDWLLENASEISRSDLEAVLEKIDSGTAERILMARLDDLSEIVESEETSIRQADFLPFNYNFERSKYYPEARWLLAAAERSLTGSLRTDFQSAFTEHIDLPVHAQLYQEGHLSVDPKSRILEYLEDLTVDAINTAQSWVEDDALEADTLASALHAYMQDVRVKNRETARCIQEAVRRLEEHAPGRLDLSEVPSEVGRAITRLTWWIDNENDRLETVDFSLSLLQKSLCWLSDEDQVAALRKAFYMHAKERLSLTPEELAACSAFQLEDADQPRDIRRSSSSTPPLGLSAEIIIQTIRRVAETGEFPREGYLIEVMQHVTKDDPARQVQILDIFNRCEGRVSDLEMGVSLHDGRVEEIVQNGRRKFIISFEYLEEIVESVKRLPGRRYDPDRKVWIVPAENEHQREATFQFARDYSFFIDLQDGKHWTNNEHLVEKPREEPPQAVTYCEGKKAKRKDFETYDFWWCRNEKCYDSCHGRHEEDDWELYTVEDFLSLLDLKVEEDTSHETIEMGQYHRFLGWMNRFNQLVDRLYCRKCGHILDSSQSSNYSHYRVTDFHCSNEGCPNQGEKVYLHHCLNPKCGFVIDSRDSEQCPNGWWICTNDKCGACCSTETLRRRRENRKEVGLPTSDYIRRFIEQKKGHIERSKHFCYGCGKEMEEYSAEQFRCPEGHVEYDLVEADFDRPYREHKS